MKYNHQYSIGFSLESKHEDGYDVPTKEVRAALIKRIRELDEADEWAEAIAVEDTEEVE